MHASFFKEIVSEKEYDFIYTGSALNIRNTNKWLQGFTSKFPDKRIILVGKHEPAIVEKFNSNPNILFEKPVPISFLPALLAKARFAVNYVPDIYPFNIQPSTKLLEYCAAGCQIISNRYKWVTQFNKEKQAGIFFINEKFDNLSAGTLEEFKFTTPDMSEYNWDNIFKEMQLHRFLPVQISI